MVSEDAAHKVKPFRSVAVPDPVETRKGKVAVLVVHEIELACHVSACVWTYYSQG